MVPPRRDVGTAARRRPWPNGARRSSGVAPDPRSEESVGGDRRSRRVPGGSRARQPRSRSWRGETKPVRQPLAGAAEGGQAGLRIRPRRRSRPACSITGAFRRLRQAVANQALAAGLVSTIPPWRHRLQPRAPSRRWLGSSAPLPGARPFAEQLGRGRSRRAAPTTAGDSSCRRAPAPSPRNGIGGCPGRLVTASMRDDPYGGAAWSLEHVAGLAGPHRSPRRPAHRLGGRVQPIVVLCRYASVVVLARGPYRSGATRRSGRRLITRSRERRRRRGTARRIGGSPRRGPGG